MVERVKLDKGRLQSEAKNVLESSVQKANLKHTPKDIQEDVIREYFQTKQHGTTQAEYGDGETADYNNYVQDRANNLTADIIEQIDNKGYNTWQDALNNEVMQHYNKAPVQQAASKIESEINKHLDSVDLTNELGSKAKATISSVKKLGEVLKKIVQTLGAKSVWLARRLTKAGLKTGQVFGTQMAFFGSFFLVFGSLFVGGVAGPAAGLRAAGYFTAFVAGGAGLRFASEALAEKLDIYIGIV